MIVCICHRVSDRDIAREVRQGCASFDDLQDNLRVATACGACRDCAESMFHAQACAGACAGACSTAGATAAHDHSACVELILSRAAPLKRVPYTAPAERQHAVAAA